MGTEPVTSSSRASLDVLVAWMPDQRTWRLAEDARVLTASLIYADRATVLCPQSDDLLELTDYFDVKHHLPESLEYRALDSMYARLDESGEPVTDENGNYFYEPLYPESRIRLAELYVAQATKAADNNDAEGAAQWLAKLMVLREDLVDWYFSQYGNHEFLKSATSIRRRIEELEAARDGIRKQTEAEILLAAFAHAVQEPGKYALVDDIRGLLPEASRAWGVEQITGWAKTRTVEASLGIGSIRRLPAPKSVPWDVIADVRQSLQEPLLRFRSAMADYSVASDTHPLDEDFEGYTEYVWRTRIDPALAELEELTREASLRTVFFEDVTSDLRTYAGPFLALTAASVAKMSNLITASVGVATPILSSLAHMRARRRAIRSHDLYFLHEVARQLGAVSYNEGTSVG
jgi:hypothetical protein